MSLLQGVLCTLRRYTGSDLRRSDKSHVTSGSTMLNLSWEGHASNTLLEESDAFSPNTPNCSSRSAWSACHTFRSRTRPASRPRRSTRLRPTIMPPTQTRSTHLCPSTRAAGAALGTLSQRGRPRHPTSSGKRTLPCDALMCTGSSQAS